MNEFLKSLKSLKSLQASPCECSAKNPDSDYPNQHTKACPRFQTMHCWCPPATGPGQPHRDDCSHYRRPILHAAVGSYHDWDLTEADAKMVPAPVDFIAEAQAYNHALQWLDKQSPAFAHDSTDRALDRLYMCGQ